MRPLQLLQTEIQCANGRLNLAVFAVVALAALQHAFGRLDFGGDNMARNRHRMAFRQAILGAAQQHIAALPPLQTPDKAAVFGEKGQVDIVFTAKTH